MAIQETTRKIHFLPFEPKKGRAKDTSSAPTVMVSTKYKKAVFGIKAISDMQMAGKFVKLYYDAPKRILGWRIKDSVTQQEMKNWKVCRPAPSNGAWVMSLASMLGEFKGLKKERYTEEVQKWRDTSALGGGDVYYFIKLRDGNDNED